MKKLSLTVCAALAIGALGSGACSSTPPADGTGGVPAVGGTSAGGTSSGGTPSVGGTPGVGGSTGGVATGGVDLGGGAGEGGEGPGVGGTGSGGTHAIPPPGCDEIPSLEQGDTALFDVVVGDSLEDCEALPAVNTCEGQPFRSGTSPAIDWNAGPAGTMSYAVVLKDITILATTDPDSYLFYSHGYHWAAWDIPAATTSLQANLGVGHEIPGINNARQYADFEYSYFGPCPNFDPALELDNTDSYSFVVYALPQAVPAIVPPAVNAVHPDTDEPYGTVRAMDDYFKSIALAATEFRVTSDAHASAGPSGPPTNVPPCSAAGEDPPDCVEIVP